ncbi:MAG: LysR family transcriptional regulator [Proteobacteria bacterium]|nr:LysR family transcriptional regulator [Pseudomonadota bacterium]
MEYLNWELSVLSRAVAFSNLSGASSHIGVSQPQLSRIVSKLEREHGVLLLNRETKRKSAWTPDALKLSELYSKLVQQFRIDVSVIGKSAEPKILRVGSLDGLMDDAVAFCRGLFSSLPVVTVDLTVGDLGELEEKYFKGSLEFLLTSREPGRKKIGRSEILGYQALEIEGPTDGIRVLSAFEYSSQAEAAGKGQGKPTFVSNSLVARQRWIKDFRGYGTLPSSVQKKQKKGPKHVVPVYLVGLDHLPESYWVAALKITR